MLLPKFLSRKISPEKSLDFLSQNQSCDRRNSGLLANHIIVDSKYKDIKISTSTQGSDAMEVESMENAEEAEQAVPLPRSTGWNLALFVLVPVLQPKNLEGLLIPNFSCSFCCPCL